MKTRVIGVIVGNPRKALRSLTQAVCKGRGAKVLKTSQGEHSIAMKIRTNLTPQKLRAVMKGHPEVMTALVG